MNEIIRPGRRLGLLPPSNAPALRFAQFWTGAVPEHPASADNLSKATYGLYGNDRFGDCGPTMEANARRQVTAYLTGAQQDPTQDDVFDLYRRSGNPDFDPITGYGDRGVILQDMLDAVHKGGIGGVQSVAYAKVDVGNLEEIRAAIAIFGSLHLGVDLKEAQQTQTDNGGPWDYVKRSGEWGGHAVLAGSYTGATGTGQTDVSVVTWAEVLGTTDAFWMHQVQEAWVVIWPEHLGTREFAEGVDQAALAAAYTALTGREFPVQPAPVDPVPPVGPVGPVPDAADQALAVAFNTWLSAKLGKDTP